MKNKFFCFVIVCASVVLINTVAWASLSVNWGNSWDPNYEPGYYFIADWLVNNGYSSDVTAARNFAQNDYIGSASYGGSDPFYWNLPGHNIEVEIVQETAGYRNWTTLGYYLQGDVNSKTQIFSGPEGSDSLGTVLTGPRTINVSENFGFYINTPYPGWGPTLRTFWYTDRLNNYSSQSHTTVANTGGDAQALIYELTPGAEWLIAWEDLDSTHYNGIQYTDNDYNDMLVKVTAHAVPEPATLSLLGLGLLGITALKRKSKNKEA